MADYEDELLEFDESDIDISDDELEHEGVGHKDGGHSGRYPWGSGEHPFQRDDFLTRVNKFRQMGLTQKEIAEKMGITAKDRKGNDVPNIARLRIQIGLAEDWQRKKKVDVIEKYHEKGLTPTQIGKILGMNESSVRSYLNADSKARMEETEGLAKFLKEKVDSSSHGMIDVGKGINEELNVKQTRLDAALYILQLDGYNVYGGGVKQRNNPGQQTNLHVLCRPEVEHKDIFQYDNIDSITEYESLDDGQTFQKKFQYPAAIARSRVAIRYPRDGGKELDGTIELRRGVADLDLGASNYAQVRIMTDNGYYLKGMALYSDAKDWPKGVDIMFNTSKPDDAEDDVVFKKIKSDPQNPFGALVKPGVYDPKNPDTDKHSGQSFYYDPKTGERKLSVINKTREEGDWDRWAKKLPSQFLAKQSKDLIKRQLNLTVADKYSQFEEIMNLTNPVVKAQMLVEFANDCDKNAKTLAACSLPGQRYQVLLPVMSLKENEIYAPNWPEGETLALVRYPHEGTFEIPICKNTMRNKDAERIVGPHALDAIGINAKTAERLSGADFDGDTAQVIPCNSYSSRVRIISTAALPGLKDFDNKMVYGYTKEEKAYGDFMLDYKAMKAKGKTNEQMAASKNMSLEEFNAYLKAARKSKVALMKKGEQTQSEMGQISNLITDMTLKGATPEELARATRHSMTVIDAAKHKLNYKKSYEENGIRQLKEKYMAHINENGNISYGASTIISRAKAEKTIDKRQGSPRINKETGELEYKLADEQYYWKKTKDPKSETGFKYVYTKKTQKSTQMDEVKNAYDLVSDASNPIEVMYADFANEMKAIANKARLASLPENVGKITKNATASTVYADEVTSIKEKLRIADLNAPRERKAMMQANVDLDKAIAEAEEDDDELTKAEKKKKFQTFLNDARLRYGADGKAARIRLTDKEWEAIQAGAITENILKRVITHMDEDELKQRATPREKSITITDAQIRKMKAYMASGYSIGDIAKSMGFSASTVRKYVKEG